MKKSEVTIQDVLKAVSEFSSEIDKKMSYMQHSIYDIQNNIHQIQDDIYRIDGVLNTQVVTKSYFDEKLANLRVEMQQAPA